MKHYAAVVGTLLTALIVAFAAVEAHEVPVLSDPLPALERGALVAAAVGVGLLVVDVLVPVPSSAVAGASSMPARTVTAKLEAPSGFKVVRIDTRTEQVVDFAGNKTRGRPRSCPSRDGAAVALPVRLRRVAGRVDFGQVSIASEKGGIRVQQGSGTLWRIRRTGAAAGEQPPAPRTVPSSAINAGLGAAAGVAALSKLRGARRRRKAGKNRPEGTR